MWHWNRIKLRLPIEMHEMLFGRIRKGVEMNYDEVSDLILDKHSRRSIPIFVGSNAEINERRDWTTTSNRSWPDITLQSIIDNPVVKAAKESKARLEELRAEFITSVVETVPLGEIVWFSQEEYDALAEAGIIDTEPGTDRHPHIYGRLAKVRPDWAPKFNYIPGLGEKTWRGFRIHY